MKNFILLQKIDNLIQHKNTGSPSELARRFRVSEKSVRDYVNVLRQLGAPVRFCRKRRSYYYAVEGYFCFTFIKHAESA